MKKLAVILLIALGSFWEVSAATRTDVNVLEATENIRYLSQEITKNYLYLYANPHKREISEQIHQELAKLVENIRTISLSTSDEDTRNILEFLIYSKDQIEELVRQKPDKEKAALMLDYSETLLEGANSIAQAHSYDFTESEKMLMKGKKMEYLLVRSAKYYMALGVGLGSEINRRQMKDSISKLEQSITEFEQHNYPPEMKKSQTLLRKSWETTKGLLNRQESLFVSNLVVLAAREMESITQAFVLYHRKAK